MQTEAGQYQYARATYVYEMCVPISSCSILTVYDTRSKGLEPPGRIDLLVDRRNVNTGGRERLALYQGSFSGEIKRVAVGKSCLTCSKSQTMIRMLMTTCERVGWELVNNVGWSLFEGRSSEPLQLSENSTDIGCDPQVYWEDVCLDIAANCFTFYAFVFEQIGTERLSRVSLFDGDREIWRKRLTRKGQQAYSFGNCTTF